MSLLALLLDDKVCCRLVTELVTEGSAGRTTSLDRGVTARRLSDTRRASSIDRNRNMPCAADIGRTRLRRIHHRVVNADWKEHGAVLAGFALIRRIHFALNPAALHRSLG